MFLHDVTTQLKRAQCCPVSCPAETSLTPGVGRRGRGWLGRRDAASRQTFFLKYFYQLRSKQNINIQQIYIGFASNLAAVQLMKKFLQTQNRIIDF